MISIGTKVLVREHEMPLVKGRTGVVEGSAPDTGGTTIYKVRVGDMILPGWCREEHLRPLHRRYTTLIFDLSGTLARSEAAVLDSAAHALDTLGIRHTREELSTAFRDGTIRESFRRMMVFPCDLKEAEELFYEHYLKSGIFRQEGIPDIYGMLHSLRGFGYRMMVCTRLASQPARYTLAHLGLLDYFETVAGPDPGNPKADKGRVLELLLSDNFEPDARAGCLMIGDSPSDISAASGCGIDSAAVLWGTGSEADFSGKEPTYLASDFLRLMEIL